MNMAKFLVIGCNADDEEMIFKNVEADTAFNAVEKFMDEDSRGEYVLHAEAYTPEQVRGWLIGLEA